MADVTVVPLPDGGAKQLHKTLMKTPRKALAFVSGDTMKSFTIEAWALVHKIIFEMPAFSGGVITGVVSIENSDSKEIYKSEPYNENDVHKIPLDPTEPLVGVNTVKVTLNTDPLSDGTCYVTFYLRGDN